MLVELNAVEWTQTPSRKTDTQSASPSSSSRR